MRVRAMRCIIIIIIIRGRGRGECVFSSARRQAPFLGGRIWWHGMAWHGICIASDTAISY